MGYVWRDWECGICVEGLGVWGMCGGIGSVGYVWQYLECGICVEGGGIFVERHGSLEHGGMVCDNVRICVIIIKVGLGKGFTRCWFG